nr:reverse transcriptase domain-containing protein [Tanacetum cinerariifolium]
FDYVVDPRVPIILERPFLRIGRALIDVYGEELTLRVDDEAITFKVGQTSKYSYNEAESINQIDVIDVAYDDYYDMKGDILYLEKLLNKDPSPNLPPVKTEDLKQMDFPDTFKSRLTHKTKKRLPSLALMERLPTDVCLLVYAMLQARSKAENLAADHLSRLENPHQDELEKKEITEIFPLETLGMIAFRDDSNQFAKVMLKYGVTHHFSTAYHPQTSGQVEVLDRGLKRILERTMGENRASWSDKLDDALWAFRTAFKTPIRCTPYKLVYRKACHLPIELEHKAYWALNHWKLKTRWTGPFTVAHVFPYGTIELSQADGPNFKVNGHRLKYYFGGIAPDLEASRARGFAHRSLELQSLAYGNRIS